jgi:DNA invertase Pin-like site-specific DNA recombinase
MPEPLRAVIYARVSTDEQNPETQLLPLRQFVACRGWALVGEYIDTASGLTEERPDYQQLRTDVRAGGVDIVVCWRYDRVARSIHALVNVLKEFQTLGIAFLSLHEKFDTSTTPGEMMFAIIAGVAQMESELIRSRVRGGMERARAEGRHVGRPPLPQATQASIRRLWKKRTSTYRISKRLGIAYSTARRYVQQLERAAGDVAPAEATGTP